MDTDNALHLSRAYARADAGEASLRWSAVFVLRTDQKRPLTPNVIVVPGIRYSDIWSGMPR